MLNIELQTATIVCIVLDKAFDVGFAALYSPNGDLKFDVQININADQLIFFTLVYLMLYLFQQ